MRNTKALIRALRGLADLVAREAARNPSFADELEGLLKETPLSPKKAKGQSETSRPEAIPDLFKELEVRGENELFLWLKDQPMPVLRALVKRHDFDAAGRSSKWHESDKLARLITDQLRARLSRGSSFLLSHKQASSTDTK